MSDIIENEFSRLINLADVIRQENGKFNISATKEECALLSERFEFNSLDSLECSGTVYHDEKNKYYVVDAVIKSKVNLEDDQQTDITEEVSIAFFNAEDFNEDQIAEDFDFDIDILDDHGKAELGEIAAQYLYLFARPMECVSEMLEMMNQEIENADPEEQNEIRERISSLMALQQNASSKNS